jgi:hypothetical protein
MTQRTTREEGRQRLATALLGDSVEMIIDKDRQIADLKEEIALLRARLRLMELRMQLRRSVSSGNRL